MRIHIAASWRRRFQGLAGWDSATDSNEVLLLVPCNAVHTYTMRQPIDVAFVDHTGTVCRTFLNLPPRRHISCRKACATLERYSPPGNAGTSGEIPPHASLFVDDGWFHVGESLELNTTESSLIAAIEESSEPFDTVQDAAVSYRGVTGAIPGKRNELSFFKEVSS